MMAYTFETFKKEMKFNFSERYTIEKRQSGSIGQVYRIRENYTQNVYAMSDASKYKN